MTDEIQEITKAIATTIQACSFIKKGEVNAHNKYKYVSIDDYYENCAKVAAGNGLIWWPTETAFEIVSSDDGKRDTIFFTYAFTITHESGQSLPHINITIPQPAQGPQTTGSALSFAEKDFMRIMFKVVTGEKDPESDQEQPGTVGKRSKTSRDPDWTGPLTKTALKDKCQKIVRDITDCQDTDSLITLQTHPDTVAVIGQLNKDAPDWLNHDPEEDGQDFFGINDHFKRRQQELTSAE